MYASHLLTESCANHLMPYAHTAHKNIEFNEKHWIVLLFIFRVIIMLIMLYM